MERIEPLDISDTRSGEPIPHQGSEEYVITAGERKLEYRILLSHPYKVPCRKNRGLIMKPCYFNRSGACGSHARR